MSMFRFGCGHLPLDERIHEVSWGARLIYAEVAGGSSGVVWDRQTPNGDPNTVQTLFPVIDRAMQEFRQHQHELPGDSRGHLCWREGRALVVMSPQQSYGYLYVTAVLEKEGHEGESEVWDMSDQSDSPYRKCPELGNWPPRVVEAREQAERDRKTRQLKGLREWDLPQAERELRWAAGKRTEKAKQRALDAVVAHIDRLENELGVKEVGA